MVIDPPQFTERLAVFCPVGSDVGGAAVKGVPSIVNVQLRVGKILHRVLLTTNSFAAPWLGIIVAVQPVLVNPVTVAAVQLLEVFAVLVP